MTTTPPYIYNVRVKSLRLCVGKRITLRGTPTTALRAKTGLPLDINQPFKLKIINPSEKLHENEGG